MTDAIAKIEPEISAKVIAERLRTMLRYGLIARFPHSPPSNAVEYRLTLFGKKIHNLFSSICELDNQLPPRRLSVGDSNYSDLKILERSEIVVHPQSSHTGLRAFSTKS